MAWEKRRRGGRYYTRSRRVGGRVVREYVGTGGRAEDAARQDADGRARRDAERQARRAEHDRLAALDGPLGELHALADLLAHAALLAAGYRQHQRGAWRKPRVRPDQRP